MLNITKLIPFLCFLIFISCDNDKSSWLESNDENGSIVIEALVDPARWDASINVANIDQLIKIKGQNLANADSVAINDVGVRIPSLNAMVVHGDLYIRVPYTVPLVIDNKIKLLKNNILAAETPLAISVPPMKVNCMLCEYVEDGEELTIEGDYFDLYSFIGPPNPDDDDAIIPDPATIGHVFIGEKMAEIVSANKMSITVLVPEGASANSEVMLISPSVTMKSPGLFRDSQWILEDFNWNLASNGAREIIVPPVDPASGNPQPVAGNYFRYKADYSAWNWDGISYKNPIPMPSDINSNREGYAVKFEIWAGSSMMGDNLALFFNGQSVVARVGNDSSIPLNKWVTVAIPCSRFSTGDFNAAFEFVMHGGDNVFMDFAIDNIRFSKL